MGLRNNESHIMLNHMCWAYRPIVIAMYGEKGWNNMLDLNIARQSNPPARHDGDYSPTVFRLCKRYGVDQCRVQTAKEVWTGNVHMQHMSNVRMELRDVGHMGRNLALGWCEQIMTMFGRVQGIRGHARGHVILNNLLTFDLIVLSSWWSISACATTMR